MSSVNDTPIIRLDYRKVSIPAVIRIIYELNKKGDYVLINPHDRRTRIIDIDLKRGCDVTYRPYGTPTYYYIYYIYSYDIDGYVKFYISYNRYKFEYIMDSVRLLLKLSTLKDSNFEKFINNIQLFCEHYKEIKELLKYVSDDASTISINNIVNHYIKNKSIFDDFSAGKYSIDEIMNVRRIVLEKILTFRNRFDKTLEKIDLVVCKYGQYQMEISKYGVFHFNLFGSNWFKLLINESDIDFYCGEKYYIPRLDIGCLVLNSNNLIDKLLLNANRKAFDIVNNLDQKEVSDE